MTIAFPKFISSDEDLNVTYDYRCSIYQQHIKKTPIGHVITEFLPENTYIWRFTAENIMRVCGAEAVTFTPKTHSSCRTMRMCTTATVSDGKR